LAALTRNVTAQFFQAAMQPPLACAANKPRILPVENKNRDDLIILPHSSGETGKILQAQIESEPENCRRHTIPMKEPELNSRRDLTFNRPKCTFNRPKWMMPQRPGAAAGINDLLWRRGRGSESFP
jgi:hypothetical protein